MPRLVGSHVEPTSNARHRSAVSPCASVLARLARLGSVLLLLGAVPSNASASEPIWKQLFPGTEYTTLPMPGSAGHSEELLHVVRLDPAVAKLRVALSSEPGGASRTAQDWCKQQGLAVAINAGMYKTDLRTHVGYLRDGSIVNNPDWHPDYESVLAFGATGPGLPPAEILDRDAVGKDRLDAYGTVIQNLRLLKGPGINVWSKQPRGWSEAAIAMDHRGRILLLFLRARYTMHDFNEALLKLPLGVVRAMHADGGPPASLSIHAGGVDLDLAGGYETGVEEHGNIAEQRELPFVLGIARPDALAEPR